MLMKNITNSIKTQLNVIDASTVVGASITNMATVDYSYLVNVSDPAIDVTVDTNEVIISILTVDLTSSAKSVDKEFADVGDEITYTINIENMGTTDATNVVVLDTITSSGVSFVPGSVTIGGITSSDDPSTGINIGNINSAESSVVTFKVVVDDIPTPNPILNNANIAYEYSVGADTTSGEYTTENNVSTTVNSGGFSGPDGIVKSALQSEVIVGENITYNIAIKNTGNLDVTDAVIFDTLPIEASFVPGSVVVDGISSTDDPNTGINIGTVTSGQSVDISFEAKIDSQPSPPIVNNVSTIKYQYIVDPSLPPKEGLNESNSVQTPIVTMSIEIIKSADKTDVMLGEILTYTITVNNKGTIGVDNLVLLDTLPVQMSFVEGSVSIDGVSDPAQSILDGVTIPAIDAGSSSVVTFEALVK